MSLEETADEAVGLIEREMAKRADYLCERLRTSPMLSHVEIMDVDIRADHVNICARIYADSPTIIFDCLDGAPFISQHMVRRFNPPGKSAVVQAAVNFYWIIRVWFFDPPRKISQQPFISVRLTDKLTLEFVREP